MTIDNFSKVVQSLFYLIAGSVAVLTYLKAKNGLLNSVNTEYQKKVLERLGALSSDLFAEFDPSSERHWVHRRTAEFVHKAIHEELAPYRSDIVRKKADVRDYIGIPVPPEFRELEALAAQIRSDPFIPEGIRRRVVAYLSGRSHCLMDAIIIEAEHYFDGLNDGRYWDDKHASSWLNNRVNDRLNKGGFGISDCDRIVNEIRDSIRQHYEGFDPFRTPLRKWHLF